MVRVVDTGFTCLHHGGDNPKADIIFIHGLGGHPRNTWSTEPFEPKAKADTKRRVRKRDRIRHFLRLNHRSNRLESADSSETDSISSKELESDQSVTIRSSAALKIFWPRHLLVKDFPEARILTYGYESKPQASFQGNLLTISQEFLSELGNERIGVPDRPIVFVAHSLGGILVKKALDLSQRATGIDAGLTSIRNATTGIIFFGTPHSGSGLAPLAQVLRGVLNIVMVTNGNLLTTLDSQHDNGQLEELRDSFAKMLGPPKENKLQVVNFRETEPLMRTGPAAKVVVPLASAEISSEWASNRALNGNHKTICKFGGLHDQNYRSFTKALNHFLQLIDQVNNRGDTDDEYQEEEDEANDFLEEAYKWLPRLVTCPYRERKDEPNPPRTNGTCEWFINHRLYKHWQKAKVASLLWVTADPGCGKSVLARHLVDNVLPNDKRVICYFFFKDGFPDQTSITGALCCMLHQIFDQLPGSFSDQVSDRFKRNGDSVLNSFYDLWDILISITAQQKGREVTCVLDALDECNKSGRDQLIKAVGKFYTQRATRIPALKFLITSRPYLDIKYQFSSLQLPNIHLSGESEDEIAKISIEIKLVIQQRAIEISNKHGLCLADQEFLVSELCRNPNRTYLWVHLIMDEVDTILLTREKIQQKIQNLPTTVDGAYDKILSKCKDIESARRLLHIVIAAERPLTLKEMALALAIKPWHRSPDEIKVVSERVFHIEARELCGLFITVVDSRIYLLHQTAREFLAPSRDFGHLYNDSTSICSLQWKSTLHPEESNRILAEICLRWLVLSEDHISSIQRRIDGSLSLSAREEAGIEHITGYQIRRYAALYWATHFRKAVMTHQSSIVEMALACCSEYPPRCQAWFKTHSSSVGYRGPENPTPLILAAYFGLREVVEQLLEGAVGMVSKQRNGRIALPHATGQSHGAVTSAEIDSQGKTGWTALHWAAREGYQAVVQQLITAGADVSIQTKTGHSALHWAVEEGFAVVAHQLIAAGTDLDMQEEDGWTALHWAVKKHYNSIARELIVAGANINIKTKIGWTALHHAAIGGNEVMLRQLIAASADVNIQNQAGWTALLLAAGEGYMSMLQILIAAGANVNVQGGNGQTALYAAADKGYGYIVEELVAAGADLDIQEENGWTALHISVTRGYQAIIQVLIAAGADLSIEDKKGRTAQNLATGAHDAIVQLLCRREDRN